MSTIEITPAGSSVAGTPTRIRRPAAARFLQQTTFGPTRGSIDDLVRLGSYRAWIDNQLALPVSLTEPYVRANSNSSLSTTRHHIWWNNVVRGPDQLRQRLAFAWSQIFVVSDRDYVLSNSQYAICDFYDMLARGATGNFRDLLESVTLHPVMGIYLSMLRNEKANPSQNVRPDENFAREVLQLFSIGLWKLRPNGERVLDQTGSPVPAFDQEVVEHFAKVFTGWNYDGLRSWTDTNISLESRDTPMIADDSFHDRSAKRLLDGHLVPAGGSARSDLTAALDNIFEHPNVGPFLARQLIQRFITSNPRPAYVRRVAAVFDDNGHGTRGDLQAVTIALFTDPEARRGYRRHPETFGKIKEPLLRLSQVWRAFDAQPGPEANDIFRPYASAISSIEAVVGQAPLRSPSVFNFYQPDHLLASDTASTGPLSSPEAQILSEINVASTNNMLLAQIYTDNNHGDPSHRRTSTKINIDFELSLADDVDALLRHLNVLVLGGRLPRTYRRAIADHLASYALDEQGRLARVTDAIYCLVGSPFHLVQK